MKRQDTESKQQVGANVIAATLKNLCHPERSGAQSKDLAAGYTFARRPGRLAYFFFLPNFLRGVMCFGERVYHASRSFDCGLRPSLRMTGILQATHIFSFRLPPAACRLFFILLPPAFCLLLLSACRQDMYNQPKYKPLARNEFYADYASARPLPPHTIPRGHLDEDTVFFTGKNDDGTLAASLPMPLTKDLLKRGQERFNIYCSVCHGAQGDGDGMIVQRGFPPPNSYHIDRLRQSPPGYFFNVITHGYGIMYSYASRVEPADRWAIVAYIRALQLARNARLDDVPADERANLEAAKR